MQIPVAVVTPPAPFALPEDIRGGTAGDSALAATIEAVTNSIAAPAGWLGRSLGEQTLRATFKRFTNPLRLPCGPVQSVSSVTYTHPEGGEVTLSADYYRLVADGSVMLKAGKSWPSTACEPDAVKVEYVAGYADVPEQARQAVILAVQQLRDLGAINTYLRSETVEGLGQQSWSIDARAQEQVRKAVEHLLANLRLYE